MRDTELTLCSFWSLSKPDMNGVPSARTDTNLLPRSASWSAIFLNLRYDEYGRRLYLITTCVSHRVTRPTGEAAEWR